MRPRERCSTKKWNQATVGKATLTIEIQDVTRYEATLAGGAKAMRDDDGSEVQEAPPSMAVELLGLKGSPDAGESLIVLPTDLAGILAGLHQTVVHPVADEALA